MPDGVKVNFPDAMPKEQIKEIIVQKYPELSVGANTQNAPQWQKDIADRMVSEGREDLNLGDYASILKHASYDATKALGGRVLSGLTFGASDWLARKAGVNPNKEIEDMIDNAKTKRGAAAVGLISGLSEMASAFPTGRGLYKGVNSGLSAIPKAGSKLRYLTPAVSGAITGGSYGGFQTDSVEGAKRGAIRGAIIGQAIDLGARGLNRAFSALDKVKGVKRGLPNVVESNKGTSTLNAALKQDKKIARQIYGEVPDAKQQINLKMAYTMDDAVKGGSQKGTVASAKQAYREFLDANKGEQIVQGKFTPAQYQQNLKKWFEGSKVVDAKGNPLKVYHGTDAEFDKFDIAKGRQNMDIQGSFFSPYELDAKGYGRNVKSVYLNIKNPADEATAFGVLNKYKGQNGAGVKAREELQKMGYDGVFNGQDEYIAFNPKQIKSVNNTGAFTKSASLTDNGVVPPPKPSDLGLTDLTANQKAWLNKAWVQGQRNTLEKAGSLGHLNEMSKELNDMIQASRTANPTGVGTVATSDTVALEGLKHKLDKVITDSGLKDIKTQYAQAKSIEDAYKMGLNYKPNAIKTRNLGFGTQEEKIAFTEGLFEQAKTNPSNSNIAKEILANQDILRETLPKNTFTSLVKQARTNSLSYDRLNAMEKMAAKKLGAADPVLGKVERLAEYGESAGALVGSALDYARKIASFNQASRAANILLNSKKPVGRPLYDIIQQYLPTSAVILKENKAKGAK